MREDIVFKNKDGSVFYEEIHYHTTKEVSELLNTSDRTIRKYCELLNVIKFKGVYEISKLDIIKIRDLLYKNDNIIECIKENNLQIILDKLKKEYTELERKKNFLLEDLIELENKMNINRSRKNEITQDIISLEKRSKFKEASDLRIKGYCQTYPLKKKTYLIKDVNTNLYKIGYSINPKKREATLQSEKPTIKLVKVWNKNIERKLHKLYDKYRVRGEWFKLNKIQVKYICTHF